MKPVFAALSWLACCAAIPLTARGDAADKQAIQGDWQVEKAELGGKEFSDRVTKVMLLTLQNGSYTLALGQQVDEGTYQVSSQPSPRAIDITCIKGPNAGKLFLGIYSLDGDQLTVCYDLGGKDRPQQFKTGDNPQRFLATYRRKK